jgi:carbamoyl-phosphate synthase large subunit
MRIAGAKATAAAIRALQSAPLDVKAIQDYHKEIL